MELSFEQLPNQVANLTTEISQLKSLLLNQQPQQQQEELLTVKECAKLLGIKVPTLYSYTQNNTIPFCKKRGKILFVRTELIAWVKTGRKKTKAEIEADVDLYLASKNK